MAQEAVRYRCISVRFACQLFAVNESGYRYQSKLGGENEIIANWLLLLCLYIGSKPVNCGRFRQTIIVIAAGL
ncbi:hypothetical protein BF17_07190 [Yersinia similis]|uniref:Transposase n=1 Tax=Yersinia similis TaxID=367190 RepID=A0ABN4CMB2_9GAMM|nr:hypothetical protein BF17_07190 [Yersinia similis]